jgi:hypothetical protein
VSLKPKKIPSTRARTWQRAIPAVDQGLMGRVISFYFDDLKWYEGEVLQVSDGMTVGRGTNHEVPSMR